MAVRFDWVTRAANRGVTRSTRHWFSRGAAFSAAPIRTVHSTNMYGTCTPSIRTACQAPLRCQFSTTLRDAAVVCTYISAKTESKKPSQEDSFWGIYCSKTRVYRSLDCITSHPEQTHARR